MDMESGFEHIIKDERLQEIVESFTHGSSISLDLEFDKNRFAFGFTVSLIQVRFNQLTYIIDAIEIADLRPIYALLEDEKIEKIVFAFGEDIRLLHSVGCFPKNVSDLSIAASLLDFEPCSLSSLTHQVLGVEEKESSQKSNWLKRPLTDNQLVYAAEDVRHLKNLSEILKEKLEGNRVLKWFEEENSKYGSIDYSGVQSFSPIRNKEKKNLTEYQLYLLEQLIDLRESIAEEKNKPGYHIVSKEVLLELAKGTLLLKDMFSVKGISKYFKTNTAKQSIHQILSDSKTKSAELGLSLSEPAIKKLGKEEFREMMEKKRRADKIVNDILLPIKDKIKDDYGVNVASFIFSNKIMNEISKGQFSAQLPYKQKLIWDSAQVLGVHLDPLTSKN